MFSDGSQVSGFSAKVASGAGAAAGTAFSTQALDIAGLHGNSKEGTGAFGTPPTTPVPTKTPANARITADADVKYQQPSTKGKDGIRKRAKAVSAIATQTTALDEWVRQHTRGPTKSGITPGNLDGKHSASGTNRSIPETKQGRGISAHSTTTPSAVSESASGISRTPQQQETDRGPIGAKTRSEHSEKQSYTAQQEASVGHSQQEPFSNNKCDDFTAQSAGTRHSGRRSAAAAQLADMQDDEPHSAPAHGAMRSSRVAWEDGAASDGDIEADSESDGASEGDESEGPDPAELIAKVNALGADLASVGDGLARLHAKVDQIGTVLTAALHAAGGGPGISRVK